MTETEIENKVTSSMTLANMIAAGLIGVVSYLVVGGVAVNPMATLLMIVALTALYFLPPVQTFVRNRVRAEVKRRNS